MIRKKKRRKNYYNVQDFSLKKKKITPISLSLSLSFPLSLSPIFPRADRKTFSADSPPRMLCAKCAR